MGTRVGLWIYHQEAIILEVTNEREIMIFGPGEAKDKQKKRLEKTTLADTL